MRFATVLVCAALMCGCGGGGGGTPTGPAVATITLTISSADNMESSGDTRTVTAVAKDASSNVIGSPALTWSSSSPSVATVAGTGASGTVTAIGDGTTTITASSGSASATVSVTVQRKFVSVALGGPDVAVIPGSTVQLVPSARDARLNGIPNATGFTFSTSDPSKVIVSSTGVATVITVGNATITATLTRDGVTASGTTTLTGSLGVTNPNSANIAATVGSVFSPSVATIAPGGQVTWTFSSLEHTVTFGTTGAPASIPASSNTTVTRAFPTAGTYSYQCTIHGGMTGSVIVKASTLPNFAATLNGANERPTPNATSGAGTALFYVDGTTVNYTVVWAGLTGPAQMAHIHAPGNSTQAVSVLVDFAPSGQTSSNGLLTGSFTAANIRSLNGQAPMSLDSLLKLMGNGNAYVNVHTTANPGGEIRGQVAVP